MLSLNVVSLEPFWYPMETDQQGDTHTQTTGLSRSTLTTGMLIRPRKSGGAPNGRVHQGYEYHYRGDGGLTHTHTQTTGLLRNMLTTGMLIRPQQSAGATSGHVHQGYEYHYRGDGGLTHTHTHTHTHTQTTGLSRNTLTTGMLIRPQKLAKESTTKLSTNLLTSHSQSHQSPPPPPLLLQWSNHCLCVKLQRSLLIKSFCVLNRSLKAFKAIF